jgi:hypothetical protein
MQHTTKKSTIKGNHKTDWLIYLVRKGVSLLQNVVEHSARGGQLDDELLARGLLVGYRNLPHSCSSSSAAA